MHLRSLLVFTLVLLVTTIGLGPVIATPATAQTDCGFPVTRTDITDTDVTIQSEPQRVVTLGPSAAQTMWEIGAEEKVIGISPYASYLEGADSRTNVYANQAPSAEKVIALEPDLVLAPNIISEETVSQLRDAGLTVFRFDTATSIDFIYDKTRLMGRLVGECNGADQTIREMRDDVDDIERAVAAEEHPRVLYTFFGFTAGSDTFVDTVITTAGGVNVAAEAGISGFQQISDEIVIQQNPQWILLNSDNPTVPDSQAYQQTTAVQEGNTVVVDANYVSQPAPRIVEPMKTLVQAMHPDAYSRTTHGGTQSPSFTLTNQTLTAKTIHPDQTVGITVDVTNTGIGGTFGAWLYVNGSAKSLRDFYVGQHETRTITLQRTFPTPGTYQINVNEAFVGILTVTEPSTPTETSATPTTSPTPNSTPIQPPSTTQAPTTRTTTLEPTPSITRTTQSTPTPVATQHQMTTSTTTQAEQPGFTFITGLLAILITLSFIYHRHRP